MLKAPFGSSIAGSKDGNSVINQFKIQKNKATRGNGAGPHRHVIGSSFYLVQPVYETTGPCQDHLIFGAGTWLLAGEGASEMVFLISYAAIYSTG